MNHKEKIIIRRFTKQKIIIKVAFGVSFQVIFSIHVLEENKKWFEIMFGIEISRRSIKCHAPGMSKKNTFYFSTSIFLKLEKHVISKVLKLRRKRKTENKNSNKDLFSNRLQNEPTLLFFFFFQFFLFLLLLCFIFFQFSFFFGNRRSSSKALLFFFSPLLSVLVSHIYNEPD